MEMTGRQRERLNSYVVREMRAEVLVLVVVYLEKGGRERNIIYCMLTMF